LHHFEKSYGKEDGKEATETGSETHSHTTPKIILTGHNDSFHLGDWHWRPFPFHQHQSLGCVHVDDLPANLAQMVYFGQITPGKTSEHVFVPGHNFLR
jgi:hypothetical protein